MESRVHSIKQNDGSGIRLQPARLRVARGSGLVNRLDCLIEGIYEAADEGGDPYLMGAVLEFQMVPKAEEGCDVTAIVQHDGVFGYFHLMMGEIASAYPEAQKAIEDHVGKRYVKHEDTQTTKDVSRGRPRKPEYEVAWARIQKGLDRDEAYQIYLSENAVIDDDKVRKRFFQAMRYRLRKSELN